MSRQKLKTVHLVGGPNGSGKSCFGELFFNQKNNGVEYVNPDIITAGLAPNNPLVATFKAGRLMIETLYDRLQSGSDIAFESTLSGKNWLHFIAEARTSGYRVKIYFLYLKSVSLNLKRISDRVKQGGHDIPATVVKRRFLRCFENFWMRYRLMADDWVILDNSSLKPKIVMSRDTFEKMERLDQEKFELDFCRGFKK